jgi:hypothetical protein
MRQSNVKRGKHKKHPNYQIIFQSSQPCCKYYSTRKYGAAAASPGPPSPAAVLYYNCEKYPFCIGLLRALKSTFLADMGLLFGGALARHGGPSLSQLVMAWAPAPARAQRLIFAQPSAVGVVGFGAGGGALSEAFRRLWEGLWLAVPKSKVSRSKKRMRTRNRTPKVIKNWYQCRE